MGKKDHKLIIAAGVGLGAFLLYKNGVFGSLFSPGSYNGMAPAPDLPALPALSQPVAAPAAPVQPVLRAANNADVPPVAVRDLSARPGVAAPVVSSVDSVVFGWFDQLDAVNKANAYNQYQGWSDDKKNTMASLIGYWYKNIAPPQTLINWWANIQSVYGINALPSK